MELPVAQKINELRKKQLKVEILNNLKFYLFSIIVQ